MPYIIIGLVFIVSGLGMSRSRKALQGEEGVAPFVEAYRRKLRFSVWWLVYCGVIMVIVGGVLLVIGAG